MVWGLWVFGFRVSGDFERLRSQDAHYLHASAQIYNARQRTETKMKV